MNQTINTKIQTAIHRCRNASKEFFLLFFLFHVHFHVQIHRECRISIACCQAEKSSKQLAGAVAHWIEMIWSALLALHRSLCSRAPMRSFTGKLAYSITPKLMGNRFIPMNWTRRFHPISTRVLEVVNFRAASASASTKTFFLQVAIPPTNLEAADSANRFCFRFQNPTWSSL